MALPEYPQHVYEIDDDFEHSLQLEVRINGSYPGFADADLKSAILDYLTGLSGVTASSAQKKVVTTTSL